MKAYLIDPEALKISSIDIDNTLEAMYQVIGCDLVEPVQINEQRDTVWVDEEGLLHNPEYFFRLTGPAGHVDLAGKGIVTGTTVDGDNCEPAIGIDELSLMVSWQMRLEKTPEGQYRAMAIRAVEMATDKDKKL